MKVSIIVAVAENGVIGDKNALLWHISEDLRRFKALTTGHAVVMGRKTYESLGRPLPNRHNVVITRQEGLRIEGCTVVHSLEEAYALLAHEQEIFIIGGAQIYAEAMAKAKAGDRFYLTRVHHPYVGDTSFPEWDAASWRLLESEGRPCGEKYPYPFTFEAYERR
uniref:dihydrofolate reductase n=1 Tax=Alistipes sp. TaxID=1872444 RepID=UPI0040576524